MEGKRKPEPEMNNFATPLRMGVPAPNHGVRLHPPAGRAEKDGADPELRRCRAPSPCHWVKSAPITVRKGSLYNRPQYSLRLSTGFFVIDASPCSFTNHSSVAPLPSSPIHNINSLFSPLLLLFFLLLSLTAPTINFLLRKNSLIPFCQFSSRLQLISFHYLTGDLHQDAFASLRCRHQRPLRLREREPYCGSP